MSVKSRAFAKINVGLRVFPKSKDDVFHKIESVFHTVNLCDDLEIDFLDCADKNGGLLCEVQSSVLLPKENTITKAFSAFSELTGLKKSVRVFVKKRIPSGAGLGGGSSDAAAFVRSLCVLHKIPQEKTLFDAISARVGSDVFFFLNVPNGEGAALVSGRGEIVEQIEKRAFFTVLLFPRVFCSTKEAYSAFDRAVEVSETLSFIPFSEYESEYRFCAFENWRFCNGFTPILQKAHPEIALGLKKMKEAGALFSEMSGSGSTVFGVFDSKESALFAVKKLQQNGFDSCI